MKVLSLENHKREVFPRDFRVHTFYSISMLGTLDKDRFNEIIISIGYHKDEARDIYVSDDEYTVIVDGNSVVLVFNPDTSRHEDRISKTLAFIQKLKDAGFEWSILSTSVVHINRYVISQFEDNEKNRKSAIDYFFKGLDGEEMAVCYQDDNVSVLRVYFEPREGTEYNINFSVSSSKTDKNGETEDLTSLLTRLEDNCYNLWRTVVPKRVLTVMKEDLKDAEQN